MASGGDSNGHTVDIDELASSLTRILEDVPQHTCSPAHPGRICRIPENLREVDVKAYEPCFLSIGPYHHGKPNVQPMEKRKWLVLKSVLENRPDLTLKDYLKEIASIEPQVRSFYSEVDMDSERFSHMLLLDSIYILTVFCGMAEKQEINDTNTRTESGVDNKDLNETSNKVNDVKGKSEESKIEARQKNADRPRWSRELFVHDLFLIENQLPFFVLQKIYDLAYSGHKTLLIDIMKARIGMLLVDYAKVDTELVISRTEEVHHLLHLGHLFFRPTVQDESTSRPLPETSLMFRLESAKQLYEAGVSFEAINDSTQYCLLDITFGNSGNMVMPSLHVDDNTNSLLRNLIALEQMKYPSMGLNVSAYAVFLLHLVTNPEDVMLLRRKEIIEHNLASDKEMVNLVNRLSVGLFFDYIEDEYSLKPIFRKLKRYTDNKKPRWRASFKHRYFKNPWTTVSLLAASLLLFLTIIQTYYAVYSYYHPWSGGN